MLPEHRALLLAPKIRDTVKQTHVYVSGREHDMGGWYIARSQLERRPQKWKQRLACKQSDVVAVEKMSQKQIKGKQNFAQIKSGENPRNSCMEYLQRLARCERHLAKETHWIHNEWNDLCVWPWLICPKLKFARRVPLSVRDFVSVAATLLHCVLLRAARRAAPAN